MENVIERIKAKSGFIIDMDGVIYHGNQILPGVPEFIQWLHDEKKEYLFFLGGLFLLSLFLSSGDLFLSFFLLLKL